MTPENIISPEMSRKRVGILNQIWVPDQTSGKCVQANFVKEFQEGLDLTFIAGLAGVGKTTVAKALIPELENNVKPKSGCSTVEVEHLTMEDHILYVIETTGELPSTWTPKTHHWKLVSELFGSQVESYIDRKEEKRKQGIDLRAVVETNSFPTKLSGIGNIDGSQFPQNIGTYTGVNLAINRIAMESISEDLFWWKPPALDELLIRQRTDQDNINAFKVLRDFLDNSVSKQIEYKVYYGIPSLPTTYIGCAIRTGLRESSSFDWMETAVISPEKILETLPVDSDKKNIEKMRSLVKRSAPSSLVLNDLLLAGRMAKAITKLRNTDSSAISLPDWAYSDRFYVENPQYNVHLANMAFLTNILIKEVLMLTPERGSIFYNQTVDGKKEILEI